LTFETASITKGFQTVCVFVNDTLDEQVIRIRDSYDRMVAEFGHILEALGQVDEAEAAPYRAAFRKGLDQMKERLG
jgi:hypothetical protein